MGSKIGEQREIILKNGKTCYLKIVHNDGVNLVIVCIFKEGLKVHRKNMYDILHKWYDGSFPDEFKDIFPEECLTTLCAENIFEDGASAMKLVEFVDDDRTDLLEGRAELLGGNYFWLRNESNGSHDVAPVWYANYNNIYLVSVSNPSSVFEVIPIFWIKK